MHRISAAVRFSSCKFTKPKQQSQSTKLIISKLTSWWHGVIYTCSYNFHQLLIVSLPQRTPSAHYTSIFFLPGPGSCDSISFSMNLLIVDISHMRNHKMMSCVECHQVVYLPYILVLAPRPRGNYALLSITPLV